jgi:hypothetical protein
MATTRIVRPIPLTRAERATVYRRFKVYRNTGSIKTGQWVYQPHDFDSSFELWSKGYPTRREAVEAAFSELISNPV